MEEENKENKKEENENKVLAPNNNEENLKNENMKEDIQNNNKDNIKQKEKEENNNNPNEANKEEEKNNNEDKPEQNIKNEEKNEKKKEEKEKDKETTDNQLQNEENKIIEKGEASTTISSQNSNQENKVNDNSTNDNLNELKKENNEPVIENKDKDNSQKNDNTNESDSNKININTDSNNANNTTNSVPPSSDENKNTNEETNNDNDISPEELKKLYNIIHSTLTENKKLDKVVQEITSMFDSITEHLISGDRNDSRIFELFGSLNFIYDIVTLMSKKNKDINIQIIKFFSVLFTNLSDKHINYFIFNCDFINQQINALNESINPDYLYYYISFVKSLILKINTRTIEYFYHGRSYSFPLLGNCLKFYNHPDSMISNTARNIFLVILKIKHPPCIEYICNLPMLTYFVFFILQIKR